MVSQRHVRVVNTLHGFQYGSVAGSLDAQRFAQKHVVFWIAVICVAHENSPGFTLLATKI